MVGIRLYGMACMAWAYDSVWHDGHTIMYGMVGIRLCMAWHGMASAYDSVWHDGHGHTTLYVWHGGHTTLYGMVGIRLYGMA